MKSSELIILNETDSTNNYAGRLIAQGNPVEGTVVLSYYQSGGRGQTGNCWESEPGMNLLATFILFPGFLPPREQFILSKITSLALVDRLRQETVGISIKWPNDIYAGKKKIAGILIETSVQGNQLHSALIGIGLNLNQIKFGEHLPNPVGLKELTGKTFDPVDMALQIRKIFMEWYEKLKDGLLPEIHTAYLNNLFGHNEWAVFKKEGQIFEARICGIGTYGQLLLEERSGVLSEYLFKEIEFIH